jgi:hypothetical protein
MTDDLYKRKLIKAIKKINKTLHISPFGNDISIYFSKYYTLERLIERFKKGIHYLIKYGPNEVIVQKPTKVKFIKKMIKKVGIEKLPEEYFDMVSQGVGDKLKYLWVHKPMMMSRLAKERSLKVLDGENDSTLKSKILEEENKPKEVKEKKKSRYYIAAKVVLTFNKKFTIEQLVDNVLDIGLEKGIKGNRNETLLAVKIILDIMKNLKMVKSFGHGKRYKRIK